MIRFIPKDGHGAVELFEAKKSHHLVAEREFGQGEGFVGTGVNIGRKTESPTNQEDDFSVGLRQAALYPLCQFHGGKGCAPLIEQYQVVVGVEFGQYHFTLFFFEGFAVSRFKFDVRQNVKGEGQIIF